MVPAPDTPEAPPGGAGRGLGAGCCFSRYCLGRLRVQDPSPHSLGSVTPPAQTSGPGTLAVGGAHLLGSDDQQALVLAQGLAGRLPDAGVHDDVLDRAGQPSTVDRGPSTDGAV